MKLPKLHKRTLLIGAGVILVLVVLLVSLLGGKSAPGAFDPRSTLINPALTDKNTNVYTIVGEYNKTQQKITAKMEVLFYNTTKDTLNEVYFHLYPNAFASAESVPYPQEWHDLAFANGYSSGGIEVSNIKVNQKEAQSALEGEANQLLKVEVGKLRRNKKVQISMDFTVTLPNASGRFGYFDNGANLGNWYPILSVYDENGWDKDIYYDIGDPFYSEAAAYNVELALPAEFSLATTGIIKSKDTTNPLKTVWKMEAGYVRDFACTISSEFKLASCNVGDTVIYSYYKGDEDMGQKSLEIAVSAFNTFTELFGAYPYKQLSIAQTDFFIGGMEYPNLVYINENFYNVAGLHTLEHVIAHEVAHQWWYNTIGNDQVTEAWIDEGLAHYSTMLYYEKVKDEATYSTYFKYYVNNGYRFSLDASRKKYENLSLKMDRPVYEFEDFTVYDMLCYDKSAMMFHSLREQMGDEAFFKSLKELYKDNMFKNVNKQTIIKAFSRHTTLPVGSIIESWLSGNVFVS